MFVPAAPGHLVLPVRASTGLALTIAFIAMHCGDEALGGILDQGQPATGVNALTTAAYCLTSKHPELEYAAVKIEAMHLPQRLVAMAWLPEGQALAPREQIKPSLAHFAAASLLPFGREPDAQGRVGLLLRSTAKQAPATPAASPAPWAGPGRGQHPGLRRCQTRSATRAAHRASRQLQAPGALAGKLTMPLSPQACICFNVSEDAFKAALGNCIGGQDARVAQLQAKLKCGSNCGSCLPALRQLARVTPAAAVPG